MDRNWRPALVNPAGKEILDLLADTGTVSPFPNLAPTPSRTS